MPIKAILIFITLVMLGLSTKTYANPYSGSLSENFWGAGLNSVTSENWINGIQIRRGEPYDEKKDPALRKGTENEEQPQSSFFAIPGLIIGIALIFLFLTREK